METSSARQRDVVVIGGSFGSLKPLKTILRGLPADFPAAVLVAQHVPRTDGHSAEILAHAARLSVVAAADGAALERGKVYVARPDHHLLLAGETLRVVYGPRENMARPSIDVLFRSAAVELDGRVIGVLLSGELDDGVAGLVAIRRCRGVTVVQDPSDAIGARLPQNALRATQDHCLPASAIAGALLELTAQRAPPRQPAPSDLMIEARAASMAMMDLSDLGNVGEPAPLTCPECQGPLWHIAGGSPSHYRCHIGHSFSADSLVSSHGRALERALWVAFRTLLERARLLEQMAGNARESGQNSTAESYAVKVGELREHARSVLQALSAAQSEEDSQRAARKGEGSAR